MRGKTLALVISLSLVGGAGLSGDAWADQGDNAGVHMGLGIASVLVSIPYGLVKTTYAIGGAVTGGLAWMITGGRSEIAMAIIDAAVGGDYVVVPSNLTMDRSLVFSARSDRLQPQDPGF